MVTQRCRVLAEASRQDMVEGSIRGWERLWRLFGQTNLIYTEVKILNTCNFIIFKAFFFLSYCLYTKPYASLNPTSLHQESWLKSQRTNSITCLLDRHTLWQSSLLTRIYNSGALPENQYPSVKTKQWTRCFNRHNKASWHLYYTQNIQNTWSTSLAYTSIPK